MNRKAILGAAVLPHPPLAVGKVAVDKKEIIKKTIASFQSLAKEIERLAPQTIVLISPHTNLYADYFHLGSYNEGEKIAWGDFSRFGDAESRVAVGFDEPFIDALAELCQKEDFPCGKLGKKTSFLDHGITVPLYFVQKQYSDFQLVQVGLSGLGLAEHYALGMKITEIAEKLGRKTYIIASGDLSHKLLADGPYGYAAEGPEYDERIMAVLERAAFGEMLDFDEAFLERAAECGHRAFCIMAGAFDGLKVDAKKLSYEGPFGVGYGAALFIPKEKDTARHFLEAFREKEAKKNEERRKNEDPYVQLARASIEHFVNFGKVLELDAKLKEKIVLEKEAYTKKAGCFVSLKKNGQLRGCIGTISPTQENIAEEIIANAISSASRDGRFEPVRVDELSSLVYSVDILSESEAIASEKELDVKRYGVIVSAGHKKGLLLPNLEGVDSIDMQVSIAKQKAGILPHEKVSLERFEVLRYE
jgi:AmmeMemoRadiSam system protein A